MMALDESGEDEILRAIYSFVVGESYTLFGGGYGLTMNMIKQFLTN